MPKVGEVYWVEMQYEDDPSSSEYRPVAIIGKDGEKDQILILVMEFTKQGPQYPYHFHQTLKVPIIKWQEAGLDALSYGKPNRTSVINAKSLLEKDYIGELDTSDLENIMYSYVLYREYNIRKTLS